MKPEKSTSRQFVAMLLPLQRQLTVYCARMLNDESETEDCLQSALIQAYQDFHVFAEGSNFRAWLFRFVTFEILNRNRKHSRRPLSLHREHANSSEVILLDHYRLESLLESPEDVLDHCDDLVARAVRELPDSERQVFLLRAVGEFKYREIAEIMDLPVGTVMGWLSRSRIKLRQILLDYGRENGLLLKDRGGETA